MLKRSFATFDSIQWTRRPQNSQKKKIISIQLAISHNETVINMFKFPWNDCSDPTMMRYWYRNGWFYGPKCHLLSISIIRCGVILLIYSNKTYLNHWNFDNYTHLNKSHLHVKFSLAWDPRHMIKIIKIKISIILSEN